MQLLQQEPLLAEGGTAADVYKNQKDPSQDCELQFHPSWLQHREASLCLHPREAQGHHNEHAQRLYVRWQGRTRNSNGDPRDLSHLNLAKITRRTAILPLCDLKNAYYEVIGEMALPLGADEIELTDKIVPRWSG